MRDRAILFVDGNNWYHGLRRAGVPRPGALDYGLVSRKLAGPRRWVATRYYIGRVPRQGNPCLQPEQRRFLARLAATDQRISSHLGRLERRPVPCPAARELREFLTIASSRIDPAIYRDLAAIVDRHGSTTVLVEKAVDVMLAVDMVLFAERKLFDTAYLLSADGDFTPAVEAVRFHRKTVIAASPLHGARLFQSVNTYIRLRPDWFSDCYS